uniref:BamA/TamA family outer membrane protein n=1 Tax=Roseihalotalea indica TaxID=2867963 RepID=A0AA49GQ19_9BACT|nr:BamA/TamA family outer membrane protein [Tunicatimonas sp. TK19036]
MRNWCMIIGWFSCWALSIPTWAQSAQSDSTPLNASTETTSTDTNASVSTDTDFITIDRIFVLGNRVTKEKIILRELSVAEGITFPFYELNELLKKDRQKLMNTRLFLDVELHIVEIHPGTADIIIRVSERWYTIPTPYFQLADRNLNVWLTNQNRDWSRLIYGIKFTQYNFRGLNQRLAATAQFGFTKKYAVLYQIPYVDRAQKNGIEVGFSYSENRNINYMTKDHVFQFTDRALETTLDPASLEVTALVGWNYRPSYYNTHGVTLSYSDVIVADTILSLNPSYFLHEDSRQQYFMLNYTAGGDHRDYIGYPLEGYRWRTSISKLGLGIFDDVDILRISGLYSHYFKLGKGFFFASSVNGYLSTPRYQPYANFRGLGYNGLWLRGYELDVIEGQSFVMQQNTISKRIFSQEFDMSRIIPIDQFNVIPISIYLKGYVDQGYVSNTIEYEQSNRLANRYLMGYGLGIDIVSFYDTVFRIEHSWKIDGNSGFFVHFRSAF